MILPIIAFGSPVLRKKCDEISLDYPELDILLENMSEKEIKSFHTKSFNELWNQLWMKKTEKKFNKEFIKLARSVYINNDERSQIKKKINQLTGSHLIEEKSYKSYL